MKFESKFNVGDLTFTKRSKTPKNEFIALEIKEINIQRCYTETQIFYLTRTIVGIKVFEKSFDKENSDYEWKIMENYGRDVLDSGWKKWREDELIPASKTVKAIIEGSSEN